MIATNTAWSATEGSLSDYEINILRVLNGEDVPGLMWGAAMSAACGHLKGTGYATSVEADFDLPWYLYEITDKGRAAIRAREAT
jgi:hypothetical protein